MIKGSIIAMLAATIFTAAPSSANETVIDVEPGLWAWSYQTIIGQTPLSASDVECLREERAPRTLRGFAEQLDDSCSVVETQASAGVVHFTLTCNGDVPGQAKGVLKFDGDSAELSASGYADAFGFMAPFTLKGKAQRTGACG